MLTVYAHSLTPSTLDIIQNKAFLNCYLYVYRNHPRTCFHGKTSTHILMKVLYHADVINLFRFIKLIYFYLWQSLLQQSNRQCILLVLALYIAHFFPSLRKCLIQKRLPPSNDKRGEKELSAINDE